MAVKMLMLINVNNAHISINIIAAISWPQIFSPRLLKATPFFHTLAVLCEFHFFLYFIWP